MTSPFTDPLAGYSPDWRKKLGLPDFSDVGAGSSSTATPDPLAGYSPNWRETLAQNQTAAAMFGPEVEAAPSPDFFRPGLQESGNVNLATRPAVPNPDGSVSTVRSMSFNEDGKEILVPTVSDDGRLLSEQEAIDLYHQTGRHLGMFDTPEAATRYAQQLHEEQARRYAGETADPEVLAGMQATAQEGLDEGPYQRAFNKIGRVGRQALASVPEQAAMGAEALARTGALISGAPITVWGKGGEIQQAAEPAMEQINELAGGDPEGIAENLARMVGPLPIVEGVQGLARRSARRAAGREAMETMGRIHEAPRMGDEAQAYLQEAYQQEPRTPNTQAVVSFQDELARVQAERAAQEAAQRARIEQPRSAIAQAVEDFDRQRYAAQAPKPEPPRITEEPIVSEAELTPSPQGLISPETELGDAAELASRADPTGAPGYLPDPLARVQAGERNPKFGKLSDEDVLARRAEVEERMTKASARFNKNFQQWVRFDETQQTQRSGTVIGHEAGRALGRMRDDARIISELEAEIQARGLSEPFSESVGGSAEDWLGLDEGGHVGPLYHGSPHRFDRFNLEKVGTGEGAQAYGHGLYFASKKDVADYYRKSLAGLPYKHLDPEAITDDMVPRWGEDVVEEARAMLRRHGGNVDLADNDLAIKGNLYGNLKIPGSDTQRMAGNLLRRMRSKAVDRMPGHTYTVELPKVDDADFLDWDKPLSEQSPKVQEALRRVRVTRSLYGSNAFQGEGAARSAAARMGLKEGEFEIVPAETYHPGFFKVVAGPDLADGGRLGATIYHHIAGHTPEGTPEAASRALREAGVPGLRYSDQMSRGQTPGQGSHNYVVFDDSHINVVERGASGGRILGTMAAGGAAGGLAGSQVGDTPEERVRNTFLGAGAGLLGGGILGQARRLGPVARELEELQARRGAAGRKPPPGALNLFDQEPIQADLLGERAGELKGSRVGMRPEEVPAEPPRETLTEYAPGQQEVFTPEAIPQLRRQIAFLRSRGTGKASNQAARLEALADRLERQRPGPDLFGEQGAVGVRPEAESRRPLELERDTPELDPDDYVNVEKFALDESASERLRREVTKVVQRQGIHPKQVVTWDETRAIANQLGVGDLPKDRINTRLNGPEMLAIRNIVSTNLEALDKFYARLKTPLDDIEKARVDRSIGYLEKENDALLGRFTRNRTQTGRDLNNLKILANRVMDPFTWVAKAANILEAGGKKMTVEQRDRIRELVAAGDKAELVNYVASLRRVSRTNQLVSLWKTGLLTNPKTHIANILGNTAMAGLETAKDLPASIVDRMLSIGTGQRAKSFSASGIAASTWKGAKAGAREAADIMRRGIPTDLSRWDLPQDVTFKNPVLRAYTELIRRGLAAPDAFFRKVALHRALDEAQRLGPLTEESALQAVADAEYAVFQGGGREAGVQSRLARAGEGLRRPLGPVGHVIAPFTRTPGNVVGATIDYSPFGAIRGARDVYRLIKATRAGASPAELRALQKAASEQLGRTITGSGGAFLGGYILARNGLMTGTRPSVKKEQDQWDLAGKQENAIKFKDRWWSLNRLSPIGNLMALGANYYLIRQNPEAGELGAAAGALGSIGTTATEQSFLRGVQELKEGIEDPVGQGGRYLKNLAASTVPAAVGATARAVDPVVRDTKGGFLDTFLSRIPGQSQNLPAQVDQLGREKERSGGPAGQFLDPTTSREYKLNDPVIRELERTGAAIQELGQGRPRPAEERKLQAALRNTKSPYTRALLERRLESATGGESREEYLTRARKEGRILNDVLGKVIRNDRYQGLPLEAQREVLEAAATKVRRQLGQARRR